jgi:hypothetical protein
LTGSIATVTARPRVLQAILAFIFWEPAHWIMQTRQFANLKRHTERALSAGDQRPAERTRGDLQPTGMAR